MKNTKKITKKNKISTTKKNTSTNKKSQPKVKKTSTVNKKSSSKAKKIIQKPIENERLVAILTYFIIGIIWYFADENMKNSKIANFHAKQALNLLFISILGKIALGLIPVFGWFLLPFFSIFIFILWLIGLIHAINSEKKTIPIVGDLAKEYLKF
ncbi:MAG: DUF4870 domain-containing protein [Nanoarchaeota archaeon]